MHDENNKNVKCMNMKKKFSQTIFRFKTEFKAGTYYMAGIPIIKLRIAIFPIQCFLIIQPSFRWRKHILFYYFISLLKKRESLFYYYHCSSSPSRYHGYQASLRIVSVSVLIKLLICRLLQFSLLKK